MGIPHEYFHPYYAEQLGTRWGLTFDPLSAVGIEQYIESLRRRRAAGGIFSIKLQYWQFRKYLRYHLGAALFDGASVVHLFRSDIMGQLLSYRAARRTGRWDHSTRETSKPISTEDTSSLEDILSDIEFLTGEDAGFRRSFALLGIRPLFITMEELFNDPQSAVKSIARTLGAAVNEDELQKVIARSSPYPLSADSSNFEVAELSESLKRIVFDGLSPKPGT